MPIERPQKEELEQLMADGKTKTQLALYYGVSRGTITRWTIYHGLCRNNGKRPTEAKLNECIDSGMGTADIAKKFGVSKATISTTLTAFGIKCAKIRIQEARRKLVLSALSTPRPLGEIADITKIPLRTLSTYMNSLKRKGEAAIVGEHEDGRGLWGIPEEPVVAEAIGVDLFIPASNAPQFGVMIEHEHNKRMSSMV